MQCEELLVEQAAQLKAARSGVRVMGYRNIVKVSATRRARKAICDPLTHLHLLL